MPTKTFDFSMLNALPEVKHNVLKVINATIEWTQRQNFGDTVHCAQCPSALECMAGTLSLSHAVASTRQMQNVNFTLACVDDGQVKLVPQEQLIAYHTQLEDRLLRIVESKKFK